MVGWWTGSLFQVTIVQGSEWGRRLAHYSSRKMLY
jgi:hypothetical protein